MANFPYKPRRTMIYVPANNARHIEKARRLSADSVIFDLQESVPASQKVEARHRLAESLAHSADFGHAERIVRINPLNAPWGPADLAAAARMPVDAILFPRMESREQMLAAIAALDAAGGAHLAVMANIESPLGVLKAEEIAGCSERVVCLVMGTTDLANECKINLTPDRAGLVTALSLVILAARAHRKCVVDGPHLNLKDEQSCEFACRQARDLGFDGKTVIHPAQLNYTNDAFTPKHFDVVRAKRILTAIEEAQGQGRAMAVVDDRLIEPSLREWAERVIALYDNVQKLGQGDMVIGA
ncbi:MAG: CoA ester lyase [Gammaproteobacteria bacterium]|nr:CoA ester lyase [Gammaproteobacteria bacterium]